MAMGIPTPRPRHGSRLTLRRAGFARAAAGGALGCTPPPSPGASSCSVARRQRPRCGSSQFATRPAATDDGDKDAERCASRAGDNAPAGHWAPGADASGVPGDRRRVPERPTAPADGGSSQPHDHQGERRGRPIVMPTPSPSMAPGLANRRAAAARRRARAPPLESPTAADGRGVAMRRTGAQLRPSRQAAVG